MDFSLNSLFVSTNKQKLASYQNLLQENAFHVMPASGKTELANCLYNVDTLDVAIVDLTDDINYGLETVERVSLRMVGGPVFVIAAEGDLNTVIQSIRRGAYDYLLEPIDRNELLEGIKRIVQIDLRPPLMRARQHIWSRENELGGIVGKSSIMKERMQSLGLFARKDMPMLISGKNGVGKNHLARTAHFLSQRRFQPFIKIDCSGSNEKELLKQLFGEDEQDSGWNFPLSNGAFEDASGGTLLLDEVADIPLSIQNRILNTLDQRNYNTSNSDNNIRLLSTTRYNPEKILESGKLQEKFYHLISSKIVEVPALSERQEDVGRLANFFLEQFAQKCKKKPRRLSNEALILLNEYSWPENVRELRNLLERVIVRTNGEIVRPEEFPGINIEGDQSQAVIELKLHSLQIDSAEEALIAQVLNETKGNVSKSANLLGISRGTLYSKMRKYGMEKNIRRSNIFA